MKKIWLSYDDNIDSATLAHSRIPSPSRNTLDKSHFRRHNVRSADGMSICQGFRQVTEAFNDILTVA
jgi:hypothetical protein